MSITRNYSLTLSAGPLTSLQVTGSVTGDAEPSYNVDVPNPSTNLEVDVAWRAAGLKLWVLIANTALTVKTNSTSVPDNTFTLAANIPQFWITGVSGTNPISVDVTKFYLTNASGGAAVFQAYAVSDQTP